MSMTEIDIRDPFECWLGAYGHRPHDLMHTFTRVDMRQAFTAGMAFALAATDEPGPAASSLTAGPRVKLSKK